MVVYSCKRKGKRMKIKNEREMRGLVVTVMGFIMLLGFMTIGFFVFPIGITLCAVIGLCYGYRKKDKPFMKGSVVALVIGLAIIIYTLCLVSSM